MSTNITSCISAIFELSEARWNSDSSDADMYRVALACLPFWNHSIPSKTLPTHCKCSSRFLGSRLARLGMLISLSAKMDYTTRPWIQPHMALAMTSLSNPIVLTSLTIAQSGPPWLPSPDPLPPPDEPPPPADEPAVVRRSVQASLSCKGVFDYRDLASTCCSW